MQPESATSLQVFRVNWGPGTARPSIRHISVRIWLCNGLTGRERRYCIFQKNEYIYWMNIQIFFWMNIFFEWIFLPYYWMNCWMNQKSAKFIRKMNKKCILRKKRPILRKKWPNLHVFLCFLKLRLFFLFEYFCSILNWIIFWIESFFGPIQRKNE